MAKKDSKEFFDVFFEELLNKDTQEELKKTVSDGISEIKKEFEDGMSELSKSLNELMTLRDTSVQIETKEYKAKVLKMADVVRVVQDNMASGADSVLAYKTKKDEELLLWLAFVKDNDLLSIDKNVYIKIYAKEFDDQLKEAFGDKSYIILS